jgi:hypothetical protein
MKQFSSLQLSKILFDNGYSVYDIDGLMVILKAHYLFFIDKNISVPLYRDIAFLHLYKKSRKIKLIYRNDALNLIYFFDYKATIFDVKNNDLYKVCEY